MSTDGQKPGDASGQYRMVGGRGIDHITEPELTKPAADAKPERTTILIVDDDEFVLRALKRVVAAYRAPIRWLTATSAEQALELLRRDEVDIVLTDIQMPGLDGWQLLDIVAKEFPAASRVATTSHDQQAAMERCAERGITFLPKPVNAQILRNHIDMWLAVSRRQNLDG